MIGDAGAAELSAGPARVAETADGRTGAVRARPAATVILIRSGTSGEAEIFMVRRAAGSRFAPDAFVFPGGTVVSDDHDDRTRARTPCLSPVSAHARLLERGGEPPPSPECSYGLFVAGVRELFEEAGVLLAAHEHGGALGRPSVELERSLSTDRVALQAGQIGLAQVVERHTLVLAPEELIPFSHWVTPTASPRRFDTRFFVTALPIGQTALHCRVETTHGEWIRPADALERSARRELKLVFATAAHLARLAEHRSVDEVIVFARTKRIRTVHPIMVHSGLGWTPNVEGGLW